MHNYKLGDMVNHSSDKAPFKVVGIREDEIEITGDFSGGTHNVEQTSWVHIYKVSKITMNPIFCMITEFRIWNQEWINYKNKGKAPFAMDKFIEELSKKYNVTYKE